MKIIYKPRQMGKTTELIKLAAKGRYKLIVCHSRREAHRVFQLAMKMKKDKIIKQSIPLPITYQEFLDGKYAMGRNIEAFLIDDVDLLITYLTPIKVEAISINKEVKIEEK